MPEERVQKAVRVPSSSLHNAVLWLLFFGLLIFISRDIYQERKTDRLAQDLASLRQESQKEIAQLRDAQSASLEQDLLRLDQLTTQVAKTNDEAIRQATSLADRTKLDLAKTVEQRHQEMITAVSDLRADLRSDIRARESSAARDALTATLDADHTHTEVPVANSTPIAKASNSSDASLEASRDEPSSASSVKKKRFWDKLNPFNRKKPETSTNDAQ